MRIYFAHSFDGKEPQACKLSRDPATASFVRRMRQIDVEVFDPADVEIPMGMPIARFEYCLREIERADIVVVLAAERVGLGVGAEMMYAHVNRTRIFVVCPEDSHYRKQVDREETIHAFVQGLSTKVFGSLGECASEIESLHN